MKPKLIIWKNNNNDTYYYRYSKYTYKDYFVGYTNQYNHTIILIVSLNSISLYDRYKLHLKKSIKRFSRFLDKLENNL